MLQYAIGNATGNSTSTDSPALVINGGEVISTVGTDANYFSSLAFSGGTLTSLGGYSTLYPAWGFASNTAGTVSASGATPALISGTGASNALALAASTTFNVTGEGGLTISNSLVNSNLGTAAGLTLTGNGVLDLTSTFSTFTGNVLVSGGTLIANANNPNGQNPPYSVLGLTGTTAPAGRTITVGSGGVLDFTSGNTLGGGATIVTTALVIQQGGLLISTASGAASNNTIGPVVLSGGTLTGVGGSSAGYQTLRFRQFHHGKCDGHRQRQFPD